MDCHVCRKPADAGGVRVLEEERYYALCQEHLDRLMYQLGLITGEYQIAMAKNSGKATGRKKA